MHCHNFLLELLSISELYQVNVELSSLAQHWKEIGQAIGIKSSGMLERIRVKYLHDVDMCLTETLATWLRGEDWSYESPGPSWEDIVNALMSPEVDQRGYAEQLMQNLIGKLSHLVRLKKSIVF